MARPGIMLYFSSLAPIRMLSDEDKGRLLTAMLEYGQDGVIPKFDGPLEIVWSFIRPMIDKDGQRYDDMKLQREYATFCKKRKKIWMPKISFDDWVIMSDDEKQRAVDPVESRYQADNEPKRADNEPKRADNSRYPITVTTTSSNIQLQPPVSDSISNIQLQSPVSNNNLHLDDDYTAAAAESQLMYFHGELGKGVVMLSDEQVESLLDLLGLDAFDHYVGKLANFIIKNNATVKSHYETILKWWKEDRGVH